MKCLMWNCQGIGTTLTVRRLGDILHQFQPEMIFLSETKCKGFKIERLKQRFNVFGISVDCKGRSGGLALLWQKEVDIRIRSFLDHHIDCLVKNSEEGDLWRFTGFYGYPEVQRRQLSWELLKFLSSETDLPWAVGGDFNEILAHEDKIGGDRRALPQIEAFRETITQCRLTEIDFEGYPFTWINNRRMIDNVKERLDRVCATSEWITSFPNAKVIHLQFGGSDHAPILLTSEKMSCYHSPSETKPFRFEAAWAEIEGFEDTLRHAWNNCNSRDFEAHHSTPQTILFCSRVLSEWHIHKVGNPAKKIRNLMDELQRLKEGNFIDHDVAAIKQVSSDLEVAHKIEEIYWRQRSRALWLDKGDRDTGFFHARASIRRKINRISGLYDNNHIWHEKQEEIEKLVVNYFQNLFSTSFPSETNIDRVLANVNTRVTEEMNIQLCQPYSYNEVTLALSQMTSLKAPGPDGMPAFFFQKYWHIVGTDVANFVLNCLNSGSFPSSLNHTNVVLIPKCLKPSNLSQFRPISLCNVLYKLISKVITNRLKPFLNCLISENQSAFVPNRLITDNVLLAFEANHFIRSKTRGKNGFMSLKLDMSKAYDRVEWLFLKRLLLRMGFATDFVNLIFSCISSVSYSFLLNGRCFGHIYPTRGLRQGDPLSPYLFLFCAESLATLLFRAEHQALIQGIKISRQAPTISHLFFADDTIIFCKASTLAAATIQNILLLYHLASGQLVNGDKSAIVFSKNTTPNIRHQIIQILGFKHIHEHGLYLGLPSCIGQSRKDVFEGIFDRIWKRIKGWEMKKLSFAGREVLIKSVLQSIPVYTMSCFLIPKFLVQKIQSLLARFLWGGDDQKGIHWLCWSDLCNPKMVGGLGMRDIFCFNLAMLGKQIWRLIKRPDSLVSQVLKAKYFPNTDVLAARVGNRASFSWRSIFQAKFLFQHGIRWRIGNGRSVRIWNDSWIPTEGCFIPITKKSNLCRLEFVGELIDVQTKTWKYDLLEATFWTVDIPRILSIPLGSLMVEDTRIWAFSKKGDYSVKSGYHLVWNNLVQQTTTRNKCSGVHAAALWKFIWTADFAPKLKFFLWRIARNIVPTIDKLRSRNIAISDPCLLCHNSRECLQHLFCKCPFVKQIWEESGLNIQYNILKRFDSFEWLSELATSLSNEDFHLFAAIVWHIWQNRNNKLWNQVCWRPTDTVTWAYSFIHAFRACRERNRSNSNSNCNTEIVQWLPPPFGVVKINFDGALPSNSSHYRVAMIARNDLGECVGWATKEIPGRPSAVEVEACAALFALREALSFGFSNIYLEGDCLQIISALQSSAICFSSHGAIVEDCLLLSRLFCNVVFLFVKRCANQLADRLVKSFTGSYDRGTSMPCFLF